MARKRGERPEVGSRAWGPGGHGGAQAKPSTGRVPHRGERLAARPFSGTGRKRHAAGAALAVAVSGLSLYAFLRGTRWAEVGEAIAGARPGWLLLSFLAIWASVGARALRWRELLADLGPVPVARLYHLEMIGILANGLLPARIGEVARAALLAARERLPFLGVLATVVVERLLDLAAVGALLVGVLLAFPFPERVALAGTDGPVPVERLLARAGVYAGLFFLGVLACLIVLLFAPGPARRLVALTLGRLSPGLAERWLRWLDHFRAGLAALRRPARAVRALAWTALVWWGIVLSDYFLFPAFDLEVGLLGACLLTAALALSVAAPQAPGFLGVFQLAVTLVLVHALGVDESVAKAAAIVLWVVQLPGLVAVGATSLALEGVSLAQLRRPPASAEEVPEGRGAGGRFDGR